MDLEEIANIYKKNKEDKIPKWRRSIIKVDVNNEEKVKKLGTINKKPLIPRLDEELWDSGVKLKEKILTINDMNR